VAEGAFFFAPTDPARATEAFGRTLGLAPEGRTPPSSSDAPHRQGPQTTRPPRRDLPALSAENRIGCSGRRGNCSRRAYRQTNWSANARVGRKIDGLARREWESVSTRFHAAQPSIAWARCPSSPAWDRYSRTPREEDARLVSQARRVSLLTRRSSWSLESWARGPAGRRRARWVPAESVFQGFGKMVRDLARTGQGDRISA